MNILPTFTRDEIITTAAQLQRLLETRGPIGNPIIEYICCYDILMDLQQHLEDTTCRCSPDEGIACGVDPGKGGYCHGIGDDPDWASHVARIQDQYPELWQTRNDASQE